MKWNVYIYNINKKRIETYNIFEHGSFMNYVLKAIKTYDNKADFENQLKAELRYYYWAKSEWEILLSHWFGDKETVKIDVYDQVMNNWDIFVDYVWNNRN